MWRRILNLDLVQWHVLSTGGRQKECIYTRKGIRESFVSTSRVFVYFSEFCYHKKEHDADADFNEGRPKNTTQQNTAFVLSWQSCTSQYVYVYVIGI